jgi:hypothetical protein
MILKFILFTKISIQLALKAASRSAQQQWIRCMSRAIASMNQVLGCAVHRAKEN